MKMSLYLCVGIRPTANIDPPRQTVGQGNTLTLTCVVTGSPEPSVRWSRVGGELGPNHQVQGNVLRIQQAVPSDRGLYVCTTENRAGSAQASSIVEVERKYTKQEWQMGGFIQKI